MDSCPLEKDSKTLIHHCASYKFMLIKGGAVYINAFDTNFEMKLPQISFCAAKKGDYGNITMHLSISSYDQSV